MMKKQSPVPREEFLYAYEYHAAYERLLRRVYDGFHMLDPLLRRLPPVETEHYHRAIYTGTQSRTKESGQERSNTESKMPLRSAGGGEPLELSGQTHSFRATAHFDPREADIEAHTVFLYELAQAYVASMKPVTEEHCRKVAERHGNTFGTKGEPLTWEHLLTMLERMTLDFDEHGRPLWPLLLQDEKGNAELARLLAESATPEQQERVEAIMKEKTREHHARKRTRRLSRPPAG